jgi:hypothetical protein
MLVWLQIRSAENENCFGGVHQSQTRQTQRMLHSVEPVKNDPDYDAEGPDRIQEVQWGAKSDDPSGRAGAAQTELLKWDALPSGAKLFAPKGS